MQYMLVEDYVNARLDNRSYHCCRNTLYHSTIITKLSTEILFSKEKCSLPSLTVTGALEKVQGHSKNNYNGVKKPLRV